MRRTTPVGNIADLTRFKVGGGGRRGGPRAPRGRRGAPFAPSARGWRRGRKRPRAKALRCARGRAVRTACRPPALHCGGTDTPSPSACTPQISEIKGIKLDNDVTVVAFKDGRTLELPPGSATNNGELVGRQGGWEAIAQGRRGWRRSSGQLVLDWGMARSTEGPRMQPGANPKSPTRNMHSTVSTRLAHPSTRAAQNHPAQPPDRAAQRDHRGHEGAAGQPVREAAGAAPLLPLRPARGGLHRPPALRAAAFRPGERRLVGLARSAHAADVGLWGAALSGQREGWATPRPRPPPFRCSWTTQTSPATSPPCPRASTWTSLPSRWPRRARSDLDSGGGLLADTSAHAAPLLL